MTGQSTKFDAITLSLSGVHKRWLILLGCCLYFAIGKVHAQENLGQDRAMRFAVIYTDEPPYAYSNNVSRYNGIVPKLVRALGRELGSEVEFLPASRKGLEASIIKGRADFSLLAPEWLQNSGSLIFSTPILNHKEFLYSLKPFDPSDKPVDWVRGKSICVHQDYTYPKLDPFFNQKIAEPIRVSSQVPVTSLFFLKKCDLLYANEHRANWIFQALSSDIEIYRSVQPLEYTYQTFIFDKSWQSEMPKINQAISKIIHSGELRDIIDGQILLNVNAPE